MMRSLTFKYVLAFAAVSLIGIVFVAVFASQISRREFVNFLDTQEQNQLAADLATLYQDNGGWENISQRTLHSLTGGSQGSGYGKGPGPGRSFTVVDMDGTVLVPGMGMPEGQVVSARDLTLGTKIVVDGETVGILISTSIGKQGGTSGSPLITAFSERINQTLLWGGLIAIGISLILALVFSRTLTRRLGEISEATQAIARGDLELQVPVRSQDEVGRLAESFNQMSTELKRSQDLRRQMTADIAHELRTPLSIILGRAETLAEGMLSPSPQISQVIYEEARRLNRLVEDLRTLSLSDAGELTLELRPAGLQELLKKAVESHSQAAREKKINLELEGQPSLPEVQIDPDRIMQVLDNLLSNALRYTPEGGLIHLQAGSDHDRLTVSIQDSGPGIPMEDLPFVFDRFYRSEKARPRDKGGSGLGLAIARSLLRAHGGDISVSSQAGSGTTFSFWLPVK